MAETLTQLIPVDSEKGYPQWGKPVRNAEGDVVRLEWTQLRETESKNFRETYGPFDQEATYEVVIQLPGFPEPFKSRLLGRQIAGPNAERQANYPFERIGQLPLFYAVT